MRVPYGPRQRIRRNRRIGKVVILITIVLTLTFASSMTTWDKPVPGRWDNPSYDELYTARRYYEINGETGDSAIFLERYPKKYAPFIRGEVDSLSDCEQ